MYQRRELTDSQRLAALEWAADAIMAQDSGDHETGWASDEALDHWLTIIDMAAAITRGGKCRDHN